MTVVPEELDEICGGDTPTSNELIGRRFQTLAGEVRALKETVEKQGVLIALLNNVLRSTGSMWVVGLTQPGA